MGLIQSSSSKDVLKRKNDDASCEESSTTPCKKLRLTNPSEEDNQNNDGVRETSEVFEEEMRSTKEELEGLTEILSSCLRCVECGKYPRGRPLFSCPLHHHICAECHQVRDRPRVLD